MVVEALTPLDDSHVLINDVVLPDGKGNIDHILIGPNGIFVIETKNYSGEITCKQDSWYYYKNFPVKSPSKQVKRNALSLQQFLKGQTQLDMFVKPILVFTDPDAVLRLDSPTVPVIKNLKNVCDFIKDQRNQSVLDSEARESLIYEILKVSDTTSQKEVNIKKWLLRPSLYIGFLTAGLIMYLFYVFSGGDPYSKWVLVTQVVDGDTIRVGRGWRNTTVLLLGVDAPETVHPDKPMEFFGPEASEFTKKTLKGKKVHLEFESLNQMDKYGRLLGYVFLSDGSLFNAELIKRGYASVIAPSYSRYYNEFLKYEQEARAAGRGIWTTKANPSEKVGKIIGNWKSKIYHLPGQANYEKLKEENRVYFDSEEEAVRAGYRKAKR